MNKYLKYTLFAIGGLVALFLIAIGYVSATFDPNEYKPLIVRLVQEKKHRTLTLAGDIKLAFFPKLGVDLGKTSLSEHEGTKEFAAVNSVKLFVAWMPLLKKELVVDKVVVDGAKANLVRYQDGKTNFDDLMSKEESGGGGQVKFDIDGVKVTNSSVSFDDRKEGSKSSISNFDFSSGRLRDGTPTDIDISAHVQSNKPAVNADINASGNLLFELEKKHYALEKMDVGVKGEAAGVKDLDFSLKGGVDARPESTEFIGTGLQMAVTGKLGADKLDAKLDAPNIQLTKDKVSSGKISLDGKLEQAAGTIHAVLTLPELEGNGKAFKSSQMNLNVDGQQGENSIKGTLTSPISGSLDEQQFSLPALKANFDVANPSLPKGQMKLALTGSASANIKKQDVALDVATKLDDSNIKAKLGMTGFASPAYRFDINIDQIDVDRYLPKEKAAKKNEPEKPIDLSALKKINATGSIRIGSLKVSNIKSSNVRVDVKAKDGRVDASPVSMNLYQGTMNGSASAVASATPQFAVKQNLNGVSVGPLIRDVMDKDVLEGKGTVSVDVTTRGATVSAMKKALNGNAALNLADGAIKGINIAQTIRNAQAKLGAVKGESTQTASAQEKTDFSELKASFNIRNGVAHNDDLSMKSPLIRLGGNGDINVGNNTMDYLAKATVVGTLQGQGGKDLSALKGVTIPVRLAGPFDALKYTVDFNAMVGEAAKAKVQQKTEELKSKATEKLQERLKGLFGH